MFQINYFQQQWQNAARNKRVILPRTTQAKTPASPQDSFLSFPVIHGMPGRRPRAAFSQYSQAFSIRIQYCRLAPFSLLSPQAHHRFRVWWSPKGKLKGSQEVWTLTWTLQDKQAHDKFTDASMFRMILPKNLE